MELIVHGYSLSTIADKPYLPIKTVLTYTVPYPHLTLPTISPV